MPESGKARSKQPGFGCRAEISNDADLAWARPTARNGWPGRLSGPLNGATHGAAWELEVSG